MPKANTELLVITKMYELALWGANHVANFPRSHRFTLGDRLEVRLYLILELLIQSKYTQARAGILRQVNLELELLRFQFRMAKDLKCVSVENYGRAAKFVNEVGQLVGGWLRTTQGAGHAPGPAKA